MDFSKCSECECTTRRKKVQLMKLKDAIDHCLLQEIRDLWAKDIETVCSCCGHGDPDAGFIVVDPKAKDQMVALGYIERPVRDQVCFECGVFFRPKYKEECQCLT